MVKQKRGFDYKMRDLAKENCFRTTISLTTVGSDTYKIQMKLSRKGHSHKAQLSRGKKKKRKGTNNDETQWYNCNKQHTNRERPSKGFWGTGDKIIYFREQGNKRLQMKGTGENAISGNREHEKKIDLGEQEKMTIYYLFQGNKGLGTSPATGRSTTRGTASEWSAATILRGLN